MSSPEELIPRAYQEEIFTHAMRQNIIAALDTGSGKTYIAVLLIRWLAAQHTGPRKVYVFIVPKVPLVEQQRNFIAGQIPLTVRGYHGELVDKWQHDPVLWAKEFNECDIMVMTGQVFLDAMIHAHWSMGQVALIVFDEAHHARKNHPYNQIMRDFFFRCDPQSRPRVLGMTASPIWNLKQPELSLKALEQNLHAKVIGVLENQTELSEHSPKPQEYIREYSSQARYPTYPTSLWDRLVALDLFSHPTIVHENLENRYFVTLAEIGPYGADYYLFSHLTRNVSELSRSQHYEYLIAQDRLNSVPADEEQGISDAMSIDSDNTDVSSRFIALNAILEKFRHTVSFDDSSDLGPDWLCPKLQVLVSILVERRSKSFQGIVFVDQRQVATTLAWILPRITELNGWISTGALTGHGRSRYGSSPATQGMMEKKQRDLLSAFKDGSCNLLISTSVGEEGLDFQACDLIVRYNQLQNMVGYVQSRGRARHPDSTYIVMMERGSVVEWTRYSALRRSEPQLRDYYQQRYLKQNSDIPDVEDPEDLTDLTLHDRYEIASTGAVLTSGSAISLLNNLCALIPRDKYTSVLQPTYDVDQGYTVIELPSALPIPRDQLVHKGPPRRTKRAAKAAAAFVACKALHYLGVFDDYLLPTRKTTGAIIEDADGQPIPEVGMVSEMIDVLVVDPWVAWDLLEDKSTLPLDAWVHAIWVGHEKSQMGIITSSPLDLEAQLSCELGNVKLGPPVRVCWTSDNTAVTLELLHDFTTLGLRWCNTSKSIRSTLTCFLVPLTRDDQPDFKVIQEAVSTPTRKDHNITREHENHLLMHNRLEFGRPLILRCLREDLTPLSRPDYQEGSEERFETYADMFQKLYGRGKRDVLIPADGPMLLVEKFARNFSSQYPLHPESVNFDVAKCKPSQGVQRFLPAGLCESCILPEHVFRTFRVFPPIIRRITDIYRARAAVAQLGLPPLIDDLVIEALTLPCANAGFNNQRLETLGDSVLKLGVVVHIYNKYPFRHEGQLDGMKANSVSNRALLARAKEIGLERFLTCEPSSMRKWRPTTGDGTFVDGVWFAKRTFSRRSLQDCMEAILGTSFLTGGINMALYTGTMLRLCFGGIESWSMRYPAHDRSPTPTLFKSLRQDAGYEFKSGQLLMEAFTHPSFQSHSSCYQRLEFLGDALIDLVVMEFLFKKFPSATSAQLTRAKARAVCAPALATIAVKQLSLHKYLLANNVELGKAISRAVPVHLKLSYEGIVLEGWKYDPPKALSDIMESVVGAILVDTRFDYEQTKEIVLRIMGPLLEVLRPDLPLDPTSELMIFLARKGCRKAKFERFASEPKNNGQNDSMRFVMHDQTVGLPLQSALGLSKVKATLAQMVRDQLEDPLLLEKLCDCKAEGKAPSNIPDAKSSELDDEKEEEFAVLGMLQLQDVDGVLEVATDDEDEDDGHQVEHVETRHEGDKMVH